MTWDAVPWFVGGGAHHSPEVARMLAYAATGGAEGIITPGDLRVSATTVPGGSVDIAPGDCLIRHRGQGGDSQTYAARNHTRDNVTLAATGGTTRSDLIVAQIEDPFIAGEPWQEPDDPTAGPYVFTRVIPNVPPWTVRLQDVPGFEGRTAIVLARVDIPANTGTITDAMITDLRTLSMPRTSREMYLFHVEPDKTGPNDIYDNQLTSRTLVQWLPNEVSIYVPEWANDCDIITQVVGCNQYDGQVLGEVCTKFIGLEGGHTMFDINDPVEGWGNGQVIHPLVMKFETDTAEEKVALRSAAGTTQKLTVWGQKNVVISSDTGFIAAGRYATLLVDVQFREVPL